MIKKRNFPKPVEAGLSVIIPAYNSERYIAGTLENLQQALENCKWKSVEIIVVDDGSADQTSEAAKKAAVKTPVKVIRQKNAGRFAARKAGLGEARGDYILLLDSRVITVPDSLKYLTDQLSENPLAIVWNGHIIMDRRHNPYARFWYTITFLAWRRYMRQPKLVHYGIKDYDYYPKGTTGFFAPRELLLAAYANFHTSYSDDRYSNDDTSLIKYIAGQSDIYMSPDYSFEYISRSTLRAFIPHTLHRGIVFIDGHLHRGGRYFWPCLAYLVAVPIAVILLIIHPWLLLALIPLVLSVFLFAKILGAEMADAAALAYVMPVFAIFYTAGMYKGLFLKFSSTT